MRYLITMLMLCVSVNAEVVGTRDESPERMAQAAQDAQRSETERAERAEHKAAKDALDVALAGRTRKVALSEAKAAMKAEFTAKQFKALKDYFELKDLIDDVKE